MTSRAPYNKKDQEEAEREMPETGELQMEEAAEKDWRGIVGFMDCGWFGVWVLGWHEV